MSRVYSTFIGNGPIPLVFIHGLFGQGKNWKSIAKEMSLEATSMLIDSPNHGHSEWTEYFDYKEFSETIYAEIISHQKFSNGFAIIGHSMGGKIAMQIALSHPEKVQLLTVVDISPVSKTLHPNFAKYFSALLALDLEKLTSRKEADQKLSTAIPNPIVRSFFLQNLHREKNNNRKWGWRLNIEMLSKSLELVGGWPEVTGTYTGPVLWLAGANSDYVKPEHMAAMRSLFPRTTLVKIKDAGHWLHSEQPEAFVTSLKTYFDLNYSV
ncbi:MAG: alpha/beta hydrolase [Propionibacterium sp.]|nr:MAG: alpha/beta hydrolase [Propionibacterium sp.]